LINFNISYGFKKDDLVLIGSDISDPNKLKGNTVSICLVYGSKEGIEIAKVLDIPMEILAE